MVDTHGGAVTAPVAVLPHNLTLWTDVLDTIAHGAAVVTAAGTFCYVSPSLEALIGLPANAYLGKTLSELTVELTSPEHLPLDPDTYPSRQVLRHGVPVHQTVHLRTGAGTVLTLTIDAAPLHAADGTIDYVVIIVHDITTRLQTEDTLRRNERFLTGVFHSIQDGISILEPDLTVRSVNPAMEQWNAPRMPLVGKKCYAAYHGKDTPCENCPSLRALASGVAEHAIVPLRDAHGRISGWVELYAFPYVDADTGQTTGLIEYVRNITERVLAEQALQESRQAERQFLSKLRSLHEVRNALIPLNNLDDLFRQAIMLGYQRLGFARLAIRILDASHTHLLGSYSSDETGQVHVDGADHQPITPDSPEARLLHDRQCTYLQETNADQDTCVIASIPDGRETGGFLYLQRAQPVSEQEAELLELYATTLGHRIARIHSEEYLRLRELQYRLIAENVSDLIWSVDMNLHLTFVSPSVTAMLGYRVEDVLQLTLYDFQPAAFIDKLRMQLRTNLAQAISNQNMPPMTIEAELKTKDGAMIWTETTLTYLRDERGHPVSMLGVTRDITTRKRTESHLSYLAYNDGLTGLPNRLLLNDRLGRLLTRLSREALQFAVMMLDLDYFKNVNDTYGHDAGDELLVQVAHRLNGCVRESDTVARISGDEFVLLLPAVSTREGAEVTARRVLAAFTQPFLIGMEPLTISTSIGIAFAPDDAATGDSLLKAADIAMYQAKARGRNTYQFHAPDLTDVLDQRRALGGTLRQALVQEEFEVYYQPALDGRTLAISCMEALVRWRHPERGMVVPAQFIDVAEELGVSDALDAWVWEQGFRQCLAWHTAGHTKLRIALNCSPR